MGDYDQNKLRGTGGGTNATIEDIIEGTGDTATTRSYFKEMYDTDFPSQPYPFGMPMTEYVLSNFGISYREPVIGSDLPGYDINNRDAYQMIQMSLVVKIADEQMYECYADGEGIAEFIEIGKDPAELGTLYYSLETRSYKLPCEHVLVIGYDEPPVRLIRGPYDLFTLALDEDDISSDEVGPWYIAYGEIFPNCGNNKQGWIEYRKIDWGDPASLSHIYSKYEFEQIMTYAYNIEVGFFQPSTTKVQFKNTSTRFWSLGLGTDQTYGPDIAYADGDFEPYNGFEEALYVQKDGERPGCVVPLDPTNKIPLPLTNDEKFLGIKDVIIYGYKFDHIFYYRTSKDGDIQPYVMLNTMIPSAISLRRGQDYIINRDRDGGLSNISFLCDVKSEYRELFGKKGAFQFHVHSSSILHKTPEGKFQDTDPSDDEILGYLKDGSTLVRSDQIFAEEGVVFPLNQGMSGYVIKRMYLSVEWDNPCMYFEDERDVITSESLADQVSIGVYPIITKDTPAPVGHNGELLDQSELIPDDDPTTTELWQNTEYHQIFDSLEKGDMKITMPFLNTEGVKAVSKYILELKQKDAPETVYVCGPDAEPRLGDLTPDGGVVSDITYSYQDSSQYTITVQSGPFWRDAGSGWSNAVNMAKTERLTLEGIIIHAAPNNMEFTVYCEKLGLLPCINLTKEIYASGDKVQVTVYNNPQGEN